jgi:hypothetical protein
VLEQADPRRSRRRASTAFDWRCSARRPVL